MCQPCAISRAESSMTIRYSNICKNLQGEVCFRLTLLGIGMLFYIMKIFLYANSLGCIFFLFSFLQHLFVLCFIVKWFWVWFSNILQYSKYSNLCSTSVSKADLTANQHLFKASISGRFTSKFHSAIFNLRKVNNEWISI